MTHPFRFGVQLSSLPAPGWEEQVQRIEALGYDSLFVPDHFGDQWDPIALQAAAAAVTSRLRVGSLVFGVDYRHPVVLAKAAATLHLLSGGRHEFGLGAGWMESDYREAGLPFDRAGMRIERLEEALQIVRSLWTRERSSFDGRHFRIREIQRAAPLPEGKVPKILVGGGGPRVLAVAGRHADIVGINPKVDQGRVTAETLLDGSAERTREKVRWVREAAARAGRAPEELELSCLVFVTAITDDPKPVREALARGPGLTPEQVAECPLYLTGPGPQIRDRLQRQREDLGISYVVIQGRDAELLERFAEEVVAPLSGH